MKKRLSNFSKAVAIFMAVAACLPLISCEADSLSSALRKQELIPFAAKYVEGDDGLQMFQLRITQHGGQFSALEIATNNYALPQTFDTLKVDRLSAVQVSELRQFLVAASGLPAKCSRSTSLTQHLTIQLPFQQIDAEGDCNWGTADYMVLREKLFKVQ